MHSIITSKGRTHALVFFKIPAVIPGCSQIVCKWTRTHWQENTGLEFSGSKWNKRTQTDSMCKQSFWADQKMLYHFHNRAPGLSSRIQEETSNILFTCQEELFCWRSDPNCGPSQSQVKAGTRTRWLCKRSCALPTSFSIPRSSLPDGMCTTFSLWPPLCIKPEHKLLSFIALPHMMQTDHKKHARDREGGPSSTDNLHKFWASSTMTVKSLLLHLQTDQDQKYSKGLPSPKGLDLYEPHQALATTDRDTTGSQLSIFSDHELDLIQLW